MPVDAQKVKDRLKALFPKANLSAKRLDELSARLAKKPADDADEKAIDDVINQANDFMPFEDIAREDDRLRTLEQKANAPKPTPTPEPTPTPAPKPSDDTPEWAKAMMLANEKLAKDLEELKTGKITETKMQQAKKLFDQSETFKSIKDEKAKEFFLKQIDTNSETPFEEQIKALEEVHSSLVQQNANTIDYSGLPPEGAPNGKPTEEELDSIIVSAER